MSEKIDIVCVVGPTASGKTAAAIAIAKERHGEIISVDSRQVYRTLNIGTEKISEEEMQGIPHHLLDVRDPQEVYTASDFVADATRLIEDIHARGKLPILAGGTHFYFDALLNGLPSTTPPNTALREELAAKSTEELFAELLRLDPVRAHRIDPHNKRRLLRALEIIAHEGSVPERTRVETPYAVTWVVINPPKEELLPRIVARLTDTLARGLVEEVRSVKEAVGDERLRELGLEYRVVGEYVDGKISEEELLPILSNKLWQYARAQKKWLKRLMVAE